jgi:uncharacterized membrane protein YfcA
MELFPWLIAATSLLVGCWIQTALGFGAAVFAAPIIVIIQPSWVPVIITVTALILSLLNAWNQRESLRLNELVNPFIMRVPGTILGAWLLTHLDVVSLQIAIATCVLLAVVITYFGKQFDYTPKRLGIASFISGITGTTTSIGGPPMALVMQHGDPSIVRANLSIYFVYSCTLSLISYWLIGLLDLELLLTSLSFIPVCLLGFATGIKARPYVDSGKFRFLLLILCSIAGLIALSGALLKL